MSESDFNHLPTNQFEQSNLANCTAESERINLPPSYGEETSALMKDEKSIDQNIPASFVTIRHDELEFCECCGHGTFGSVYRGHWLSHGRKEVAIKRLFTVDKEAHILNLIRHRNIVQFFGGCVDSPEFCLVMEYAPYGSLFNYLMHKESENMQFDQLVRWSRDIAMGMNYLHAEAPVTVIHRDLKSKNVVICEDYVLKICDFGASRFFSDTAVMTVSGTYPWMAPELIQGLPTSELCDVYSFGVVLWELFTREIPFKNLVAFQVAWVVVERKERPQIPLSCPQKFSQLMRRCWSAEVVDRPSFREIIDYLDNSLYDGDLTKTTNDFLKSKNLWLEEIKQRLEKIKQQEEEFVTKEEKLKAREDKLKHWEDNLKKQMKNQTFVIRARHLRKSEKLNMDVSGKGRGAMESVKDAINHVMERSSFGKNKTSPGLFRDFPNSKIELKPDERFHQGIYDVTSCNPDSGSSNSGSSTSRPSNLSSNLTQDVNKEAHIKSSINFNETESEKDSQIFSKAPFQQTDNNLANNFPKCDRQKQVSSSSSEKFSFEGAKLSRSKMESKGGQKKAPNVETWETANGDAKLENTIDKSEYDCCHPDQPLPLANFYDLKFGKPELTSTNLLEEKIACGSVKFVTESEIDRALKKLNLNPTIVQELGADFCRNLSETLQTTQQSKQNSSQLNSLKHQINEKRDFLSPSLNRYEISDKSENSNLNDEALQILNKKSNSKKFDAQRNNSSEKINSQNKCNQNEMQENCKDDSFQNCFSFKQNDGTKVVRSIDNNRNQKQFLDSLYPTQSKKPNELNGMIKLQYKDVSTQTAKDKAQSQYKSSSSTKSVSTQTNDLESLESKFKNRQQIIPTEKQKIFDSISNSERFRKKETENLSSTFEIKKRSIKAEDNQCSKLLSKFTQLMEKNSAIDNLEIPRLERSTSFPNVNRSKTEASHFPEFRKHDAGIPITEHIPVFIPVSSNHKQSNFSNEAPTLSGARETTNDAAYNLSNNPDEVQRSSDEQCRGMNHIHKHDEQTAPERSMKVREDSELSAAINGTKNSILNSNQIKKKIENSFQNHKNVKRHKLFEAENFFMEQSPFNFSPRRASRFTLVKRKHNFHTNHSLPSSRACSKESRTGLSRFLRKVDVASPLQCCSEVKLMKNVKKLEVCCPDVIAVTTNSCLFDKEKVTRCTDNQNYNSKNLSGANPTAKLNDIIETEDFVYIFKPSLRNQAK